MKRIKLTQGQYALVDDIDFKRLNQWKWCALWHPTTRNFTACRNSTIAKGKEKLIYMHREITGVSKVKVVDHKNHNRLDNRRKNLRICTHQENLMNRTQQQKNNTSGYKGVHWDKIVKKWKARIQLNGKRIHLGNFSNIQIAVIKYNMAAKKLYGQFANLNIIT